MVRIQEDPSSSDEDDSRVAANNNASSSSSALTSPSSDKENARSKGKGSGGGGAVSKANAKGKGAVRGNGKGKGKGKEVVRRHGGGLAEIGEQNEILESEEEEEGSEEEGGEEEEEVGEEEEEEEEEENGEEQDGEGEEEEEEEEQKDTDMFDPDQDPEERRQVRMQYRELGRKLNDNKNEYLQPHSDGLLRTFEQAEQLFKKVKQTSDATIDSRILVQATDLALKKATNLTYGNSGATIDADEFVGQCIAFMRSSTRPPPANNNNNDDDDNAAADDAMDWAYLGRMAAFKGNKRPATTDFLLGPLSVTKKIRIMKARRQGLRRDNANLVRPVEVTQQQGAGEKAEANGSSAMSALVQKIYLDLKAWFRRNPRQAEKGLSLFRFVVNPDSFGQTVENMFYLSFLVKDGFIAIAYDEENGLPVIHCTDPASQEDHKEFDVSRSQVIFSITMWEWQEMKRIFDITESMIPTRAQEQALTSATGWYS